MPRKRGPDKPSASLTSSPIEFHMTGYEIVQKKVKPAGTSGRIYVPNSWVGKLVKVVRLEE